MVSILACLVVFVTTYALILPAITQEVDSIDFTPYLTEVKLQVETSTSIYENLPTDADGNYLISPNQNLQFSLAYTIPQGTLKNSDTGTNIKTITYQLPPSIKIKNTQSGNVMNGNEVIGIYTIDTDGQITIVFNDDIVNGNETADIIGHVSVKLSSNDIETSDNGKSEIKFREDGTPISVKIYDEYKTVTTNDLRVTKSETSFDAVNGIITYRIEVSSENGTTSNVVLSDVIQNNVGTMVEGSLTCEDSNGNSAGNPQVSIDGSTSTITLGQMSENSKYILEYKVKVNNYVTENWSKNLRNDITATSTGNNGEKLIDTSYYERTIPEPGTVLTKYGKKNDDGTITWTVTVNEAKKNIGGYTLSDILNGSNYSVSGATLTDSSGSSSSINLPYTFPANSTDTYTITYKTSADVPFGKDGTTNKVSLSNGSSSTSSETTVGSDQGTNTPVSKLATNMVDNSDGTATITWTVTFDSTYEAFASGWSYTDELWGVNDNGITRGHWYTLAQIKAVKASLDEAISKLGLNNLTYTFTATERIEPDTLGSTKTWNEINAETDASQTYKSYKITFKNELPIGTKFSFTYTSTIPADQLTSKRYFQNSGHINANGKQYFTSSGKEHEKTQFTVNKVNKTGSGYDDWLNYGNLDDGKLSWEIQVSCPKADYIKEDLILIEELPDGLDLKEFVLTADNLTLDFGSITGGGTYTSGSYTIEVTKDTDSSTYRITLPQKLLQEAGNSTIRLRVETSIRENYDWGNLVNNQYYQSHFENKVTIQTQEEEIKGSSSQTQHVTKYEETTPKTKVVDKSYFAESFGDNVWYHYKNNTINYTLTINPYGADLIEGSATIKLTDTLIYGNWYSNGEKQKPAFVTLVPGSVKVYKVDENGNKIELSSSEYSYLYTEVQDETQTYDWGTGYNTTNTLTITLPDSTPLIVEYAYRVSGNAGASTTLDNSAVLEGLSGDEYKISKQTMCEVVESSADAHLDGLTLVKVDSEDNSIVLEGARFALYQYNSDTRDYEVVQKDGADRVFITDEDGTVRITSLDLNKAYKLEEIEAPKNYGVTDPYYFIIESSDTTKYPVCKPDNFVGNKISSTDTIYLSDEKEFQDITVKKYWQDSEGIRTENPTTESVKVSLYREKTTIEDASNKGKVVLIPGENNSNQGIFTSGNELDLGSFKIGSVVTVRIQRSYDDSTTVIYYKLPEEENFTEVQGKRSKDGLSLFYDFDVTVNTDTTEIVIKQDTPNTSWKFKEDQGGAASAFIKSNDLSYITLVTTVYAGGPTWWNKRVLTSETLENVNPGATLTFTIRDTDSDRTSETSAKWSDAQPTVSLNGINVPEFDSEDEQTAYYVKSVDSDTGITIYSYTILLTEDYNELLVYNGYDPDTKYDGIVTCSEFSLTGGTEITDDGDLPSEDETSDFHVSTFYLNASNSWSYEFKNLRKYSEDGTTKYTYYLVEDENPEQYIQITSGDKIYPTAGYVYLENQDIKTEGFELPETGGIGSDKFIIIGSSIVLLSTLTLVYRALKKK